jgi:hypothetical protein
MHSETNVNLHRSGFDDALAKVDGRVVDLVQKKQDAMLSVSWFEAAGGKASKKSIE